MSLNMSVLKGHRSNLRISRACPQAFLGQTEKVSGSPEHEIQEQQLSFSQNNPQLQRHTAEV